MTNKLDKTKQQEDYRECMAIKNEEDALRFWEARVSSPVGKPYFTPMDYQWITTALRAEIYKTHVKHWTSIWGLFHASEREESADKFESIEWLFAGAIVKNTDYLGDWVKSRYDIGQTYLIPDEFSETKEESPEYWEVDNTLSFIEEDEADGRHSDYEVLYYWQEVKPAGEPANDGRRHCILVDRVTHQEAPLLPGQEPFPR